MQDVSLRTRIEHRLRKPLLYEVLPKRRLTSATGPAGPARAAPRGRPAGAADDRSTQGTDDSDSVRDAYGFRNRVDQRLRTRCATTRRARGHLDPR